MLQALDAFQRSFADAAGVTVENEDALEHRRQHHEQDVADDAVSEFRREDLPDGRIQVYKPIQRLRVPLKEVQLSGQQFQVVLQVQLELQLRRGISLLCPGLDVGQCHEVVYLFKCVSHTAGKTHTAGRLIKCSARAHREAVGAVVVVQRIDAATVEVQVAGVGLTVRSAHPIVAVAAHVRQAASTVGTVAGGVRDECPVC